MKPYIALLRAVNVGGTGKLPMAELKAMCEAAGFEQVKTYIASGNVVFLARGDEGAVKTALETKLKAYAGKPVGVMVRTPEQMRAVLAASPFSAKAPNRTVAVFLDDAPPADAIDKATGRNGEELALGTREIHVHYGDGMADSKLKIPAAAKGTARNMKTIAKLTELVAAL